jgi:RimJ/RimL family protein N-acetyltransferase
MQVRRHIDAAGFVAAAGPLLADEAQHVIFWLILGIIRERPELLAAPPYLASIVGGSTVVGAAAMLPGNPLSVSPRTPAAAMPPLVDDLCEDGRAGAITSVLSTRAVVREFCAAWCARSGALAEPFMEERLFRIDAAPEVPATSGRFRLAVPDDGDLITAWALDFELEALGRQATAAERMRLGVRARLEGRDGGVGLWEDGGAVVAMVGYGGASPTGMRIAPVYTPPALRGRGYATAATAATTRHLFAQGRRSCFLFTDLANPTSNRIYPRIGYRPVSDWTHMRVTLPAT